MSDQEIVKVFVKGISMSGKVKDDSNGSAPKDKTELGDGEASNS
jgi:hypothetical protein|tara:strand:- start:377 stop:508 length:132 start_codon:yes stop_codon:yes gene_type:complete